MGPLRELAIVRAVLPPELTLVYGSIAESLMVMAQSIGGVSDEPSPYATASVR
jgi:hypothetical protein